MRRSRRGFIVKPSAAHVAERATFALGCYTFMKNTLTIILSGLILLRMLGRSRHHRLGQPLTSSKLASDISWRDGYVLHVTKRDGTSIEGIQIITTTADGQKADHYRRHWHTYVPGSVENAADDSNVRIILHNAQSQDATKKFDHEGIDAGFT